MQKKKNKNQQTGKIINKSIRNRRMQLGMRKYFRDMSNIIWNMLRTCYLLKMPNVKKIAVKYKKTLNICEIKNNRNLEIVSVIILCINIIIILGAGFNCELDGVSYVHGI